MSSGKILQELENDKTTHDERIELAEHIIKRGIEKTLKKISLKNSLQRISSDKLTETSPKSSETAEETMRAEETGVPLE